MKKIKIVLITLLFMTITIINICPIYANSSQEIAQQYESSLLPEQTRIEDPEDTATILPRGGLSAKYSSVDKGYVTSVKDQKEYGVCWAFSACSAAETSLIKKGIASKNSIDLSEAHLAYYLYNTYADIYGNTQGDKTVPLNGSYYNIGGNNAMTVHAIDNFGFADEKKYPYDKIGIMSASASKNVQYDTSYILKNAYAINSTNKTSIKSAIQNYGSVAAMYYSDDIYYQDLNNHTSYYNYTHTTNVNHVITIVGWDDNYSKSNFHTSTSYQPQKNGAWLVKNSWGSTFGESGYFWMSYEEASICNIYAYDCDIKENNDIYQYDGSTSPYYDTYSKNNITFSNIYKVKNASTSQVQQLKSVSFGTNTANVSYTIKIYGYLTDTADPTSGILLTTQTGNTTYTGMHNVDIKDVYLGNDSYYSIVVYLQSLNSDNISYLIDYPTKYDWVQFINNTSNEYSYIKKDNTNQWNKLSGYTARIKGYTALDLTKINIYSQKFTTQGSYTYSGLQIKPKITSDTLKEGTDYNVTYYNNINAGKAYALVQGIGKYAGIKKVEFTINKKSLSDSNIKISNVINKAYTGSAVTQNPTVKYGSKTLKKGTDYTLSYSNNIKAGTAKITIKGKGNYSESITKTFTINKKSLSGSNIKISNVINKTYTGSAITQNPTVKYGSKTLKKGTDYTLIYSNNIKAGTAKVTIKGKGNYSGSITKTFKIIKDSVQYSTHIQNIGWQSYKYDGASSGTTGKSLRLEAIKIFIPNQAYKGSIQYRTHIQNIGWEKSFKSNNAISGTSGKSLRLEAIQIKLTGDLAKHYDVYYRVHCQNFGWMGWAKNGQSSGSAGYSYRLEAIQIKLVKKGSKAPGNTNNRYLSR